MRTLLAILCVAVLAVNLAACGDKGRLKSPSQIEAAEAKKARKAAKEKDQQLPMPADDAQETPAAPATEQK